MSKATQTVKAKQPRDLVLCCEACSMIIHERVLHVLYETTLPPELVRIASCYEGFIPDRVGLNFPWVGETYDYVIVYPKKDPYRIREHEERHARFFMDKSFHDKVMDKWNRLTDFEQRKIERYYASLGYPLHVIIDEWQADNTFLTQPVGCRKKRTCKP